MLQNHFKTAWRSLRRNKGLTSLHVAGLAVGMAAALLIFSWVRNEMSYDGYHKDADRIYRLTTRLNGNSWKWDGSPMLIADALKREVPGIETVTRLYRDHWPMIQVGEDLRYEKRCAYVDYNWFGLFRYRFIKGNAPQSPYDIVLTASTARKYFGAGEAVGAAIHLDSTDYVVRGVVEDAPANSSFQYDLFIPIPALMMNRQVRENGESWDNTDYRTFIKLSPGVPVKRTERLLTTVLQKYEHDDQNSIVTTLEPLKDMHFEKDVDGSAFVHGNLSVVYIFALLGFLLLVVACINYVNLSTAKASMRSREVSIRKIVGADRKSLFAQFIAESALVSLLALGVAILFTFASLPAFNTVTDGHFTLSLLSGDTWAILGSTLLAAFLLNSVYPALLLSSFKPLNVFRGITVLKVKDAVFRKGLVVLQFSISIVLMTGTIVIYRQMHYIQATNPGYERAQVLAVQLPFSLQVPDKSTFTQTIKQDLLAHSSIESVGRVNQSVLEISSATTGADWDGRDTSFRPKVNQLSADADVAQTMHLQMARGLAAFAAEQRTKEIGIRKILGATMANITTLLTRDFLVLVGIAVVIASPLAWWAMNGWLENFAYRVSVGWWTIGLASLLALLIAFVVTGYHSIKANLASPVKSLRSE